MVCWPFFLKPSDAIDAGVALLKAVNELNSDGSSNPSFQIGIGVHSGDVMLGTLGEDLRMDTTIISDTVNTASRLESINKIYGSNFLISQDVYKGLNQDLMDDVRYLGPVLVKGRVSVVSVYEIITECANRDLKVKTLDTFVEGIRHFSNGELEAALSSFDDVLRLNPDDLVAQRRRRYVRQELGRDDNVSKVQQFTNINKKTIEPIRTRTGALDDTSEG
eukprot:NODE_4197_length_1209_cov_30.867403_g3699_i0.p1 GENE.NODE_4197_length_1209_cov_30.867403_g3699_i0~~NODE_4197_length_1209_cov_30.867403_g3699_i0.p1  ORF type:complete len:220 (-),score=42.38 NODE_4197_length_1209_cov_30.867403_g3699_i0:277-936(-)